MKYTFVWIILLLNYANLVKADEVLHGETGDWNKHSVGLNPDDPARFTQGSLVIAQAIEAAKAGEVSKFIAFWNVNTNNPPAQVMECYKEWR